MFTEELTSLVRAANAGLQDLMIDAHLSPGSRWVEEKGSQGRAQVRACKDFIRQAGLEVRQCIADEPEIKAEIATMLQQAEVIGQTIDAVMQADETKQKKKLKRARVQQQQQDTATI